MKEIKEKIKYYIDNPVLLQEEADKVCREQFGDKVYIRGLIEFSNYCSLNCLYCGIREANNIVNRYRIPHEDIIDIVKMGFSKGIRTFVLQSGEGKGYPDIELCKMVEGIKNITGDEAAVTLSCGIKSRAFYKDLRDAGCDRYLLRFETSDPDLHKYLRNGITLKNRLIALENLKSLDYETGSGFMTGLPGETEEILINNILLCYDMKFDMVGIGPFIPHDQTPLSGSVKPDLNRALIATALVRILLPGANMPATTAAGSLNDNGREKMLSCGANVLMPNITPAKYKKDYLLYPGKVCLDENGFDYIDNLDNELKQINKRVSFERGDSKM